MYRAAPALRRARGGTGARDFWELGGGTDTPPGRSGAAAGARRIGRRELLVLERVHEILQGPLEHAGDLGGRRALPQQLLCAAQQVVAPLVESDLQAKPTGGRWRKAGRYLIELS